VVLVQTDGKGDSQASPSVVCPGCISPSENISDKNCYYSELTGLYWVWKNCHDVDYVGTCHYRRYLLGADDRILMEDDYEKLLSEYDLITTKQVALNNSYYYGFCANHNKKGTGCGGRGDKRILSGVLSGVRETGARHKDVFREYVCHVKRSFMMRTADGSFPYLPKWKKRICLETGEDAYHKRVFGFISEIPAVGLGDGCRDFRCVSAR